MSIDPDTELLDGDLLDLDRRYAEPDAVPAKPVPRHARPREYTRIVLVVLGSGLVAAVGVAAFLWTQLDTARSDYAAASAASAELAADLADARDGVAELEEALATADQQLAEATDELSGLREQLAEAEEDSAAAGERLATTQRSLDELRSSAGALASSVFGSVDPVDACERASARVAEEAGDISRGAIIRLARDAAEACQVAAAAVQESVPRANTVLAQSRG